MASKALTEKLEKHEAFWTREVRIARSRLNLVLDRLNDPNHDALPFWQQVGEDDLDIARGCLTNTSAKLADVMMLVKRAESGEPDSALKPLMDGI